jgi:uncharacterized protein (TIGR03435 family)
VSVPIFDGPAWLGEDRWNITAKWNAVPANGHPTLKAIETAQAEMEVMLQTLLEQRFQLKLHREERELSVYELTVANPGKLTHGTCTALDLDSLPAVVPGQQFPDYCGGSRLGRKGVDWTLDSSGMKMVDLANTLTFLIGSRIVIDKTGFTGLFDAHLRWTPGPGEFGARDAPPLSDDMNESIFSVLHEQLGPGRTEGSPQDFVKTFKYR